MKKIALSIIFSAIFFSGAVEDARAAITPVARFDVVPYQRIENGGSFKVGVVAFSKPGIEKIDFSATGQGYSGGTKTVTAMSLNDQTDVWEYWTTFASNEFTGNGVVTINATVTDNDGNHRDLALSMIVEGASAFSPVAAWVSPTGNNTTCVVNNENSPCQTIAGAITKIQSANSGSSNGASVYLQEGTYALGNATTTTSEEWLTIAKDSDANEENVIINSGGTVRNTSMLRIKNVTVQSQAGGSYVFETGYPENLWLDGARVIGAGRHIASSNPVHILSGNVYATEAYVYDVDYGFYYVPLVRGTVIDKIGNDPLVNTQMVINTAVSDVTNGNTGWHSDVYQSHTTGVPAPNNRIVYGLKATDVHYEGIFLRSDAGLAQDNAFVNNLIELRETADLNESSAYAFMSLSVNQSWEHLIFWNNTFLSGHCEFNGTLTDSSIAGNIFYQFIDDDTAIGTPSLPEWQSGNSSNNEALHNHFIGVYGETTTCVKNSRYTQSNWPCPHWYAKKPDSGASATATVGEGAIDVDPVSPDFTYPVQDSVLIDRFVPKVPIDIYNRERGATSDVGAVEYAVSSNPPAATCSDGIQNQDETGVDCGGSCDSCATPPAPSYQCSDGLDNDSDSLIDFPIDPGCTSASDNDEYNAPQVVVPPSDGNNDDNNNSSSGSSKKKTVKNRTVSVSKKSLTRGQTLIERGKKFSKNSPVLLYFSKAGGGYYPPKRMITNSKGSFSLSYKIPANKPKGTYSWYAVDEKTGKKSNVVRFVVR